MVDSVFDLVLQYKSKYSFIHIYIIYLKWEEDFFQVCKIMKITIHD